MPRLRLFLYGLLALRGAGASWPRRRWSGVRARAGRMKAAATFRPRVPAISSKWPTNSRPRAQRDDALKAYKGLLRRWPLSFFAPEAQYRMGKILEDEGDFYTAFQAFQKMVTKYPSSELFRAGAERAVPHRQSLPGRRAAAHLEDSRRALDGPDGRDVRAHHQERALRRPMRPQCQFNIGLARENQRKFTDAVDAYQKVLDNYPTSSVASNAQYQIGYAWMRSSYIGRLRHGRGQKGRRCVPGLSRPLSRPATRPCRRRKISRSSARSRPRAPSTSPSFTRPQHRHARRLHLL